MPIVATDGDNVVVKFDDGLGTYTPKCMINLDRSFELTNNLNESAIPDCDDPSKPDSIIHRVVSQTGSVSGAGIYDIGTAQFFYDWWKAGDKKNVHVEVGGVGGQRVVSQAVLTTISVNGPHKDSTSADLSIQLTGDIDIEAIV